MDFLAVGFLGLMYLIIVPLVVLIALVFLIYSLTKSKNNNRQQKKESNEEFSTEEISRSQKQSRSQFSLMAMLLALGLFLVMLVISQRALFDLNRFLNPVIEKEVSGSEVDLYSRGNLLGMFSEQTLIGENVRVFYPKSEQDRYLMWKLIIHGAAIGSLVILTLGWYFTKKEQLAFRPLMMSFLALSICMTFQIFGEAIGSIKRTYPELSLYLFWGALAILLGVLAYRFQEGARVSKNS